MVYIEAKNNKVKKNNKQKEGKSLKNNVRVRFDH